MAKHSVRVYSDCLRRELVGTNIKVITMEPSFYRTEIVNYEMIDRKRREIFNETPEDIREAYGENHLEYLKSVTKQIERMTKDRIDDVVDSIIAGIVLEHPKPYYRCCSYHELFTLWGTSHLPEILVDMLLNRNTRRLLRQAKSGPYQDKKLD